MNDPLSAFAIIHAADKFGMHDYTVNYHDILHHMRTDAFAMMEIGIGGYDRPYDGGYSLLMWQDYFQNATITGIDIQPKTLELGPRVKLFQGSQTDPDFLQSMCQQRGPFRVIVDDGSHQNDHIIFSFEALFSELLPGGHYLIEDVQTSFYPHRGGSLEGTQPNAVHYFAALTRDFDPFGPINAVRRFHNMIALEKQDLDAKPSFASDLAVLTKRLKPNKTGVILVLGEGAPDVSELTLPYERVRLADPIEDVLQPEVGLVLYSGNEEGFDDCLARLAHLNNTDLHLAHIAPDGDKPDWIKDRFYRYFCEVDHIEMKIHYPDVSLTPFAEVIYEVALFAHLSVLRFGRNDFPSNVDFKTNHPTVQAYAQRMTDFIPQILAGPAIRSASSFLKKTGHPVAAAKVEENLTAESAYELGQITKILSGKLFDTTDAEKESLLQRGMQMYGDKEAMNIAAGRFMQNKGDNVAARGYFEQARKTAPENQSALVLLIQLDTKEEKWSSAVAYSRQLLALDDSRIMNHFSLVRSLARSGHEAEAREAYNTALQKFAGDPKLENFKGLIPQ